METIAALKARHARTGVTLGHGAPGGIELPDGIRSYLGDFLAANVAQFNADMTRRLTSL